MSRILLVEPESRYVERIKDALGREGWQVQAVDDHDHALQAAAADKPLLILVNTDVEGADLLLAAFRRSHGGDGAIALLSERRSGEREAWEGRCDACLTKPFSEGDLRLAVRRTLSGQQANPIAAEQGGRKLTSEEIFGDLLAELSDNEEAAGRGRSVAEGMDAELNRKLEETLSGVLGAPPVRKPPPPPPPPPVRPRTSTGDVDALLSRTLSDLDLGGSKPSARPAPPAPAPAPPPSRPAAAPARTSSADNALRAALDALTAEAAPSRKPAPSPAPAAPAPAPAAAATQKMPVLGDTEKGQPFGPYVLLQKIATGGMAEVWRARQSGVEGFQKEVAIKRILPHLTDNEAFVSMFVDEAKLAAQLSHPNIIHIYDLGKIGSDYYIAMEYVEGHNLREILSAARRRNMKVPLGLALLVASRLASALDYAHRKKGFDGRELGLVHRDVSPQNVLISSEGEIKLCDFGIVKAVSKASHTQMGALKGKLQYMSPEQAWGRPLDGRSDIFALGAILFEIMTGRRLFAGDNEVAILDAVREGRIQSPRDLEPSVPENVERLVLKALEKNPEQRFSSAGTLQMAAENVLYALKPTPTQADLATWLRRLFGNEPLEAEEESSFADLAHLADLPGEKELAAPLLADEALPLPRPPAPAMDSSRTPAPAPAAAMAAPTVAMPAMSAHGPRETSSPGLKPVSSPGVVVETVEAPRSFPAASPAAAGNRRTMILLAALLLVAVLAGGWWLLRKKGPAAPPEPGAPTTTEAAGPASAPQVPPTGAAPAPGANPEVEKIVDEQLSRREQELRKQHEADLKKLQQQLAEAEKKKAAQAAPAATTPAPPSTQPAQGAPPEPAPDAAAQEAERLRQAEAERQAAAEAEARRVEEQRRAEEQQKAASQEPAAEAPEAPRIKVGQLVEPGPGVVAPSLVSYNKPEYPPQARRLRVEGIVEVAVLVDENGAVSQARVTKPISQNVGLNEAALAAAKTARFRPATKDGVRVKVWTAIRFPFKL